MKVAGLILLVVVTAAAGRVDAQSAHPEEDRQGHRGRIHPCNIFKHGTPTQENIDFFCTSECTMKNGALLADPCCHGECNRLGLGAFEKK